MNKLVQEIIKPILEADSKITKVVGIYGGRFQPFGPHHYKTYKWLEKQVDDAYITTSNIKKPPRHPMNFKEKVRHMSKMGVPASRIIEEKSPYVAKSLAKKYDEEKTVFVYVFGAKDAGRLGGGGKYFQDYKKNITNLKGHKHHGYYLVAPHVSMSVGGKEVSGTTMRELLGSDKYDDKERAKLFKKMFGYYDKGVFNMMTNKFKKLFENDMLIIPWDNTKPKPKNPKLFDKKKRDLLKGWIEEGVPSKLKKVLGKYVPNNIIANNTKLISFISKNPMLINQLLRLATEDVNEGLPSKVSSKYKKLKVALSTDAEKDFYKHHAGDNIGKPSERDTYDWDDDYKEVGGVQDDEKDDKVKGWEPVKESVDLPIKVGDVVKMGRFKNKKVVIKSIEYNEKGDLLINGRPALKFRIVKSKEIDEFLIHNDINKLLKEVTVGGGIGADDGPNAMYGGMGGYAGRNKQEAEQLGWEVIDYILDVEVPKVPPFKKEFEDDRIDAVTFMPSGIGTGTTANNQVNLTGTKAYNKWKKWMSGVAQTVGMELMKFKKQKDDEKAQKKAVSKDSRETLKVQKKDEKQQTRDVKQVKVQESFTKDWWKKNLTEKIVTKTQLKPRGKELLLMGGAYGHMAHPFDDKDLTFGDLKKIITDGLGGHLNREDGVTEKLDGQNIMISWKDGKLIAARNKGHIKNGGKTALDAKGMASKFKGRGEIANAFNFAMKDLGKSIGALSEKQKTKIFNNGYNFMNLEVMWPKSANVIDYDVAHLVFHGALKYDDSGKVIGEVPGSARMLAGMIKQVNMHIGKKYSISKPVFLTIPKHQDFSAKKDKFIGKLNKLRNQYGLKDEDTLGLYHQSYWEEYIYNAAQQFGYTIPNKILENLTKRWAFFDKSYKIPKIKKDLKKQSKFLEWVLSTDKNNHKSMVKKNMKPFETLFFEVGAEILKNVEGFMAASPNKAVQGIRKRLKKAISSVKAGGDLKKLNTLKAQLDKLNAIGGTEAIVPSEGIVFKYQGKTYKFTGAFAPINQITGLISF